jgi:hypothetical protein
MRTRTLLAALALFLASPALAVDQGEWQLSAGPSFALLVEGNNPTSGLGGRIEGRYGLTDDSSAWAAVSSSWHPRAAAQARASSASAGFALAFNVFRVVPFAEVGAAVTDVQTGSDLRAGYLGFEGAGGAEYLFDRHWSAAAVARYQYLVVKLGGAAAADRNPGVLTVGLRLGRSF